MKDQNQSKQKASREARHSRVSPHKIYTAQWWQDRHSEFKGSDDSLYIDEIIEELGGVEVRRYLSIDGGTDLSRAAFEERETKAGLARNPPPGVEPLDHWRNELKRDQQENNPDYRPGGLETVSIKTVGIGEEVKKEHRAALVKWDKAWKEAEVVINKDTSIDSRTVDLQQVFFDKTVETASKHGVSPQFINTMRNAQQMVTRESCIIPKVAEASAALCSRLARRAHLEAEATEAPAASQEETKDRTDAKHAKERIQGKPLQIGKEVDSLISRYREGLTRLRKAKANHPSTTHLWRSEMLKAQFTDTEIDVLMNSKNPEAAACRMVAQKHEGMTLKTVQNYYSDFKNSDFPTPRTS